MAFVVLHKSQYFGRQRHFCGPVPPYRPGRPGCSSDQLTADLACIVLSPSPSPFADNNPLHPPTARNGGHCCNRVHRPMRTANWANSVEPRAWQECRAPHTGTHTHLQPQCTARHTVGASGLEHISVPGSQTEDQRGRHRLILFVQPTVPRSP